MQVAVFQEQQISGTSGGAPTGSTYNQRALNVQISNTAGWTFSSNVVSLPAGTYLVRGMSVSLTVGHQVSIYDFTNNAVLLVGINAMSITGPAPHTPNLSIAEGIITLTSTTSVGLNDYFISGTTGALGAALSGPNPEVYSQLTIILP